LRRNRDIVANGQGAAQELRELRRQVTESERRIEDKRSGITTILTETNEELRAQMNNFELNMQTRTQEQRNLQRSVDMLQNEIAQLRASTEDLNIKRGQGQSLKQSIGESQKKDYRYMKIAVQFVHSIVARVVTLGPLKGFHMALLSNFTPRSIPYMPIGEVDPPGGAAQTPSHPTEVRAKMASTTDMRLISNTFHVQGITDILLVAAAYTDDSSVVQKAVTCLAILDFMVIKQPLMETPNVNRIFSHCISRVEWHYPALSLIIQVCEYP
jgi:hypothetical protein